MFLFEVTADMFFKKIVLLVTITVLIPGILSCDEAQEFALAAEPARPYYDSLSYTPEQEFQTVDMSSEITPESDELTPEVETFQEENIKTDKDASARIASHLAHAAIISGFNGAQTRLTNAGLPKNTRQSAEGYWIGAWPTSAQLEELYARNVRLIITAANIGIDDYQDISNSIQSLGMTHVSIPFGGRFPNPEKFDQIIQNFSPEQVFIHCEHGGDRSGAILAYLLIVHHGWSVPRALLSVAFPGKMDSQALVRILENRGYEVSDEDLEEVLGIYSGENNGGYGGLKVRSEGYVKLINTTIDAAIRQMKKQNI